MIKAELVSNDIDGCSISFEISGNFKRFSIHIDQDVDKDYSTEENENKNHNVEQSVLIYTDINISNANIRHMLRVVEQKLRGKLRVVEEKLRGNNIIFSKEAYDKIFEILFESVVGHKACACCGMRYLICIEKHWIGHFNVFYGCVYCCNVESLAASIIPREMLGLQEKSEEELLILRDLFLRNTDVVSDGLKKKRDDWNEEDVYIYKHTPNELEINEDSTLMKNYLHMRKKYEP